MRVLCAARLLSSPLWPVVVFPSTASARPCTHIQLSDPAHLQIWLKPNRNTQRYCASAVTSSALASARHCIQSRTMSASTDSKHRQQPGSHLASVCEKESASTSE